MTKGAFQISRDIFNNDIWDDVPKFRIFFYILGNAVFSEDGIKHAGIKLERGQYLRSLRGLRDDLAYKEGQGVIVWRKKHITFRTMQTQGKTRKFWK